MSLSPTDATVLPSRSVWWSRLGRLTRSRGFAWGLSVAVHAALFAGFWLVVLREEPTVRRVIIPEARLAAPQPMAPASDPRPLDLTDPDEAAAADSRPDERFALTLPDAPSPTLASAESAARPAVASMVRPAEQTVQTRTPVSRFFGQTGNAYRVVYVVDVSASLMIYIEEILREMRSSIRDLIPTQRFHIVLARPMEVEELRFRRLVPAIARYREEASAFLDTIERIPKPGKADPVEAMRRAFAVEPELVYFLSDGDYRDIQSELLAVLNRLNADRRVAITTIGFDPSPRPRALLERIARRHGGHFRAVEPR